MTDKIHEASVSSVERLTNSYKDLDMYIIGPILFYLSWKFVERRL